MRRLHTQSAQSNLGSVWKSALIGLVVLGGCGKPTPTEQTDAFGKPAADERTSMGLPIQAGIDPTLSEARVDVYQQDGTLLCCLTIGEIHDALAEHNVVQTRKNGAGVLITVLPGSNSEDWDRMELFFGPMDTGGLGLAMITQDGFQTYKMGGSVRRGLGNTNQYLISAFPQLHVDEAYNREQAAEADEERRVRIENSRQQQDELVKSIRKTVQDCREKASAQASDLGERMRLQEECIRASQR